MDKKFRQEKDSMGTVKVPEDAYFGANTKRALDNFIDSGLKMPKAFLHTLALIKKNAARTNHELGLLDAGLSDSIIKAASEVMHGKFDDQFVVDVFQTGSGTSTNMNMNEVISSRANELNTGEKGGKTPVHPNDHVNLGQSSNDVIPSALHVSALNGINRQLVPSLKKLLSSLSQKALEFKKIGKLGRTHLQDAVPMSLGNEFAGYARQIELGIKRIEAAGENMSELALGGTAVGSGMNTHTEFASRVIKRISDELNLNFREAVNHFEAQGAQDASVEMSGALKTVAAGLFKIANDIRWLASGPRSGIGEIILPSLQPGSSIMPGKINPIIPESVMQIAAQVIGNDAAITIGGMSGNFELNTMLPLIAYNLLQSIELLASGTDLFAEKCISGIQADEKKCRQGLEKSLAIVTYLVPEIGYDKAAEIAHTAYTTGQNIKEVILEQGLLTENELKKIFNPVNRF